MKRDAADKGASVRARLHALARGEGINLEFYLVRYALERLLYRLGRSEFRNRFILKGAMLQPVWFHDLFRPTRDLDLLAHGDSEAENVKAAFRDILSIDDDDGIFFDLDGLSVEPTRRETDYGGLRLETTARLTTAQFKIQMDIGFGDIVVPDVVEIEYPVLLDSPAPQVRAYPKEAVVAEKLQAIVTLGTTNSRMKDFYDLWMMSRHVDFEGLMLAEAISATFNRRNTPLPDDVPVGLSDGFAADAEAIRHWGFFTTRNVLSRQPGSFAEVVDALRDFVMPPIHLANGSAIDPITWPPGGPWNP